ncbi:hypothetical protein B0A48_07537 [Cryoendolithus antarcticus]|uniref:Uncharacterized protein n=1 Tax=Cryoendolithus antarcticus TaxID=1507870 RepID=A0A1V8T6T2_9PEZI|nr:hypothetical protein B0A48_07537 [Cryoendolithus antarcticus]
MALPSAAAKQKKSGADPPIKRSRGIKVKKAVPTPEPGRSVTPAIESKLAQHDPDPPQKQSRGVKVKDKIASEGGSHSPSPAIKQEIKAEHPLVPTVKLEDIKIKKENNDEDLLQRAKTVATIKSEYPTRGGTPPVKPSKQIPFPEKPRPKVEELQPVRMRTVHEITAIRREIGKALEREFSGLNKLMKYAPKLSGEAQAELERDTALKYAEDRVAKGIHISCEFREFEGYVAPVSRKDNSEHEADKAERFDKQLASMMNVYEQEKPRMPEPKVFAQQKLATPRKSMPGQAAELFQGKKPVAKGGPVDRDASRTMTPDWRDRSVTGTSASYTPQPEQEAVACWELGFDTKSSPAEWIWKQSGGWSELVPTPMIKVEAGGKRKLESIEEIEEQGSPRAKKMKLV